MKRLKLTTAATVLTLALSFSAFAGDMETGIVGVPTPTQASQQSTQPGTAATGVTGTTSASTSSTSNTTTDVNGLTQIALLLMKLLARI